MNPRPLVFSAVTTGAFAFVALSQCPVELPVSVAPGPPQKTAPSAAPSAEPVAEPVGKRLYFGPASPQDPAFATWSRSGFAISKSGVKLATWTDCPCHASRDSGATDCRIAVWDLPKKSVTVSFEAYCVPEGPDSIAFSPSEDRLYVSSVGIVSAHDLSDGHAVYELGEPECKGFSTLSSDGEKLFRFGYCGGLTLYRASDGAQIGAVELPGINEIGDSGITWDQSRDVIALSVADGSLTLFPLRGGRPARAPMPSTSGMGPPRTEWIPGTSRIFVRHLSGFTALLDTKSNTLRSLRGAETTKSVESARRLLENGQGLSASKRTYAEVRPSKHLWVYDLPSGDARDLGVAVTDADVSGGFRLRLSPDGRRAYLQLFESPSGKPDEYAARIVDLSAPSVGAKSGDPKSPKPPALVDSPVSILASEASIVDWLPDGSLLVRRGKALSALDSSGKSRPIGQLPEVPREVALLPDGRAVIAIGRNLSWMNLESAQTATFVLTKVNESLVGRVEGVRTGGD